MTKRTIKTVDTPQEIIKAIKDACDDAGTKREWAWSNGFEPGHISDYINRKRSIPNRVLNLVGWERVTIYRRIEE